MVSNEKENKKPILINKNSLNIASGSFDLEQPLSAFGRGTILIDYDNPKSLGSTPEIAKGIIYKNSELSIILGNDAKLNIINPDTHKVNETLSVGSLKKNQDHQQEIKDKVNNILPELAAMPKKMPVMSLSSEQKTYLEREKLLENLKNEKENVGVKKRPSQQDKLLNAARDMKITALETYFGNNDKKQAYEAIKDTASKFGAKQQQLLLPIASAAHSLIKTIPEQKLQGEKIEKIREEVKIYKDNVEDNKNYDSKVTEWKKNHENLIKEAKEMGINDQDIMNYKTTELQKKQERELKNKERSDASPAAPTWAGFTPESLENALEKLGVSKETAFATKAITAPAEPTLPTSVPMALAQKQNGLG